MSATPTTAALAVTEYAGYLRRARSEASFQRALEDFAKLMGWLVFHDRDSRKNDEGFPDVWAARDGMLVVAELKVGRNTRTQAQLDWAEQLVLIEDHIALLCGDSERPVRYFVWRPEDWEEIVAVLKQPWIEVVLT